jgi:hypothetical protein
VTGSRDKSSVGDRIQNVLHHKRSVGDRIRDVSCDERIVPDHIKTVLGDRRSVTYANRFATARIEDG